VADGDSPFSGNLFVGLAGAESGAEHFEELLCRPGFRVERIVSTGQASPPGFWYDQDVAEWVVLLSGAAELQFEDETAPRTAGAGRLDRHRGAPPPPGQLDRPLAAFDLAGDPLPAMSCLSARRCCRRWPSPRCRTLKPGSWSKL
jgi:hypothetical protein